MFIRLKYLLLTKGVQEVNAFLDKNPKCLSRLSEKNFNQFISLYFDRNFDTVDSEPLYIIDFIWNYEDFNEDILLNSKYFKTITGKAVLTALASLTDCTFEVEKTANYLISKLDSKQLMNYPVPDIAQLTLCYLEMGLEKKLLECKNINLLIAVSNEIAYDWDAKDFNNKIIPNLSLPDFKEYCLKGNIRVEEVLKYLKKYLDENREVALDALFDIFINIKEPTDYATEEKCAFKKFFMMIAKSEIFSEEDKNYLGRKLLETKKYEVMYDWLYYIDCSANYQMIDELIDKWTVVYLLSVLNNNKYLEYAISKYIEKKSIQFEIPFEDAIFLGYEDLIDYDKLNQIVNILFRLKPETSISKENAIQLMKKGVDIFPILIKRYILNTEERGEILKSIKEHNRFDLCAVYGSYLLSGNNQQLLNEQIIKREETIIRSLKPNKPVKM